MDGEGKDRTVRGWIIIALALCGSFGAAFGFSYNFFATKSEVASVIKDVKNNREVLVEKIERVNSDSSHRKDLFDLKVASLAERHKLDIDVIQKGLDLNSVQHTRINDKLDMLGDKIDRLGVKPK